jgi:hypothetical protein
MQAEGLKGWGDGPRGAFIRRTCSDWVRGPDRERDLDFAQLSEAALTGSPRRRLAPASISSALACARCAAFPHRRVQTLGDERTMQ